MSANETPTRLLLVPLEDIVVFPNMNVTLTVDVGDEERVLLVPKHDGEYAKVGTVAEVTDHIRLPGGGRAVALNGLHRGVGAVAQRRAVDAQPRHVVDRRVEVAGHDHIAVAALIGQPAEVVGGPPLISGDGDDPRVRRDGDAVAPRALGGERAVGR